MLIIWSQLQLNSLSPAQPGPARPRPWPRTSLRRGCRDEMSSLFGEQQSRRFPSTSDRLWTESWWIFRTRARALAQPANCYRAALTNLCRCINRSQAALTRPPCFSPQQKKKKKRRRRPNKQARREELCLPAADEEAAIRERRSFTYPPHGFVWFCLTFFIYAFIYFFQQTLTIRRNPTAHIFKYYRYSQDIRRASSPRTRYYHRRNWY